MKARRVSYSLDASLLDDLTRVMDEEVIPAYKAMPQFVGLVLLRSERFPREVTGISLWNGDLEDSDDLTDGFLLRLQEKTDTFVTIEPYEVLRVVYGSVRCSEEDAADN